MDFLTGNNIASLLWLTSYIMPIVNKIIDEINMIICAMLFKTMIINTSATSYAWIQYYISIRAKNISSVNVIGSSCATNMILLLNNNNIATKLVNGKYYIKTPNKRLLIVIVGDNKISISCIIWNGFSTLLDVIQVAKTEYNNAFINSVGIYNQSSSSFTLSTITYPRNIKSIIMPIKTLRIIDDSIISFINDEKLYKRIGRKYKMNILLYGPPGTGKSSIVGTICAKLSYTGIYIADLLNKDLWKAISSISSKSIILFEDIDRYFTIIRNNKGEIVDYTPMFCMASFLNFLDGVNSLEKCVVIMTANNINIIPPVLLRPGRVDIKIEMTLANHQEVTEYTKFFYTDIKQELALKLSRSACINGPIAISVLQEVFFRHKNSPTNALIELNKDNLKIRKCVT